MSRGSISSTCVSSSAFGQAHAARDDEQLAGLEHDVAVAQLDRQPAREDQEEVVGLVVLVPDELARSLTTINL